MGSGGMDEGVQKTQNSSYIINKSGDVMYKMVMLVTILYCLLAKRVELESSQHKKKNCNYVK